MKLTSIALFVLFSISTLSAKTFAACVDNVVMVHGNAGNPGQWDNTYNLLRSRGYAKNQIFRPNWGSKVCPFCNNHSGSEETPVRNAIKDALASSCTGKIDVIGHSLGVTLAAQQIIKLSKANQVDSFVGIAGAYRGLYSCGIWPAAVANPSCGRHGLSISSPFLDWLYGKKIANRVYSIKSWVDQIVCATGTCLVWGKHSSQIKGEKRSYTYGYGHLGLQSYTAQKQYDLIK